MTVGERTQAAMQALERGAPRGFVARVKAFYFAHRPAIVLGMGLYLALVHLVAAGLLWDSRWPGVVAWKLGFGSRWVELDERFRNQTSLLHRRAAAAAPGAAFFIGDSLLGPLDAGALVGHAVPLSIVGDTARRVASRIRNYPMGEARLVFLHVGTNDLRYRAPEALERPFRRVLRAIPRHVPVVASAILPVDRRVFARYGNAEIGAANRVIRAVCTARPGCTFLDAGAALADATGNLDPRYHRGDGLHLAPNGYRAWREALAPALARWREP